MANGISTHGKRSEEIMTQAVMTKTIQNSTKLGSITVSKEELKKHDGLFTDTCNFLDHKILDHMGIWAYLNGGRPHLERFFESENYDGKREEKLIRQIAEQAARDLPEKISLIELGPGKAFDKKTVAFIEAFEEASGRKRFVDYTAVDIVEDYAKSSAEYIGKRFTLRTDHIVGDYYKIKAPIDVSRTPLLISWNTPIWNAPIIPDLEPDYIYASSIKKVGNLIGPEGTLILTHFPSRNGAETASIYNNDDNRKAVLAIPALIESRLNPVCRTADGKEVKFSKIFDYKAVAHKAQGVPDWDKSIDYVEMNLVAKTDVHVKIGNYETVLHEGEEFNAVRSAKPSVNKFNHIARIAKAESINMLQSNDGSVVAQTLRFPTI